MYAAKSKLAQDSLGSDNSTLHFLNLKISLSASCLLTLVTSKSNLSLNYRCFLKASRITTILANPVPMYINIAESTPLINVLSLPLALSSIRFVSLEEATSIVAKFEIKKTISSFPITY